MSAIDQEALKTALFEKIDTLPQRDAIDMADARQWVDYMAHVMPNEAMWHLTRASGIGGSEIGLLVKNYLGHPADFMASAHDWAKAKLLQTTPEPSGGALRRGIELEPIHRGHFTQMYQLVRHQKAFDRLNNSHAKDRPWLRYSADDVVIANKPTVIDFGEESIEVEGLLLIDYKAPTTVNKSGASFQYACQLHQGAIICEENDIELEATVLSQWDLQEWRPVNDLVMINPELKELIKRASDHYWGCVLRGEIPDYIYSKRYQLDEGKRQTWEEMVKHLAMLNAMKSQIERKASEVRELVVDGLALEQARLESQRVEFKDYLRISATSSIDEEKVREVLSEEEIAAVSVKETSTKYNTADLVRYVKEQGIDVKPFRIPSKLDAEKTFNLLAEKGLDADAFMTESLRFTTDRKLTGEANVWVEENLPMPEVPEIQALHTLEPTPDSAAAIDDTMRAAVHHAIEGPNN